MTADVLMYGKSDDLSRLNEICLRILNLGLLRIRDAGADGDHRHCEIEADHLHNIPSIIARNNEKDLRYYLLAEVPSYLAQINVRPSPFQFNQLNQYLALWLEIKDFLRFDPASDDGQELAFQVKNWKELQVMLAKEV